MKSHWKLDNTANYFAIISNARWRPMHRLTVLLKEAVDPILLKQALARTLPRFPHFTVQLHTGFFCHYYTESACKVEPQPDDDKPFMPLMKGEPLFRVSYYGKKISLEMQHVLGDGYGSVIFLKTLLAQYFIFQGIHVPSGQGIFNVDETPDPMEFEDCYGRFIRKSAEEIEKDTKAYRIKGQSAASTNMLYTTGTMLTEYVLQKAHDYKASLTEYLTAVLAYSVYTQQCSEHKKLRPINIFIPADLRRYYQTKTLRNFSLYSNVSILTEKSGLTFQSILEEIQEQCRRKFTEKSMYARLLKNMRYLYYPIIKVTPLCLKKFLVFLGSKFIGENTITTNLSNLGMMELPEEIRDKVERFETMGNNSRVIKLECGAVSYNGNLTVAFTRALKHSRIEHLFFEMLKNQGIPVSIESNVAQFSGLNYQEGMHEEIAFGK